MSVSVTHVKRRPWFTVYVGRAWDMFAQSEFHNPFHIAVEGTREKAITKFLVYWFAPEQKQLREKAVREIKSDDVLGCWCHPQYCHADIIAGYVNWKHREQLWL